MYIIVLCAQFYNKSKCKMSRSACALLFTIFLLSLCTPGLLRKTTSHRYPSSGGLSGAGHKYPSSHGLSGTGSGHIQPSHSAPSYTQQSHSPGNRYPSPGGSSGSPTYPNSNGMSGNNNRGSHGSTTHVHHHYHYNAPQQIHYAPRGSPAYSYPVYRGNPPTYVYQYKDSSSKYGTLLAGLALLNLGALTASTFAHHRNKPYQSQPGEICKLGIRKENGDYEETKIKCELISSFIWAEEEKKKTEAANSGTNSTRSIVTTMVTNTTTMVNNNNNVAPATPLYTMLLNSALIEVNDTLPNAVGPNGVVNGNTATSSVTTVTTTNMTTVSDALDAKNNGPPVKVTDGMQCYVIRHTPTSNMRHTIPCGLLQTYASKSLTNAVARNISVIDVFTAIIDNFYYVLTIFA